jgi:hypothetical protein
MTREFRDHNIISSENAPRCREGHMMQELQGEASTFDFDVICDVCSTSQLQFASSPYWSCSLCEFDLCSNCNDCIQSVRPPFCDRGHSLIRLNGQLPSYYYGGTIFCDMCELMSIQEGEYWHCYECGYDMCEGCQKLACLSCSDH